VTAPGILSVLVPAVGGQGGGVLSEWLVEAALLDGHAVHGTSIPGVAQRTGSTTYYVEIATGSADDGLEPAFSLYPVPGALDVLLAPEFLEVGRMIEQGFVSPNRTTVVCSTHRLYSIHEKIATGRAIYPREALERAARAASRTLVAFDALALARTHGTEVNAVLLGALAGVGALPLATDAYRKAIERKGVGVKANLAGFELGLAVAGDPAAGGRAAAAVREPTPHPAFTGQIATLPEAIRPIVALAVARLVDYQDAGYARRYLDRLRPFVPGPGAPPAAVDLARIVARHLATWMSYEDAVRVAQLKTRATRFDRIRAESRAGTGAIVVTDYLKPDLDEILGVLPHRLVAPVARWATRRWPHGRPTLGQHVRTTTITGFLRVWLLTRLRPLRPLSHRAHEEHARMERWLASVRRCAGRDLALAGEVARAAQLVKGYGDVRRRMALLFDDLLARVERVADLEAERGHGYAVAHGLAARYRALVLEGPDGEAQAPALAAHVETRLATADPSEVLAIIGGGLDGPPRTSPTIG
jgi:indolepyruvate ferredoxin oxidoreductase beta subunit